MGVQWQRHRTAEEAARACASWIVDLLEDALLTRERATVAVSGGTTARLLFEPLAEARVTWDRIHLFFVDERAAPSPDVLSNFRLAEDYLIFPAHIPRLDVHRIQAELTPEVAARRYSEEIREFFGLAQGEMPQFDVIHCGMGADGHTASLFPGEPLIDDRQGIAAAVYADRRGEWRITLLPGVLLAAGHTVFLVTGAEKAEAVRAVFHEPSNPKKYPAQIPQGRVTWFLDDAAASLVG